MQRAVIARSDPDLDSQACGSSRKKTHSLTSAHPHCSPVPFACAMEERRISRERARKGKAWSEGESDEDQPNRSGRTKPKRMGYASSSPRTPETGLGKSWRPDRDATGSGEGTTRGSLQDDRRSSQPAPNTYYLLPTPYYLIPNT